jgi:sarcosine oxidase
VLRDFDVIVVGGGAMGTAAARVLAGRGRATLLLERFDVGHSRGSSGGPTRAFRLAYDHPDYVRMARIALDAWRELEEAAGEPLLVTTGGIYIGGGADRLAAALGAAGERVRYIAGETATERWPGLRLPPRMELLVDEEGGVCYAERTVLAQVRLFVQAGGTLLQQTKVERLEASSDGARVLTAHDTFRAPVAIVTAGSWAGRLLADASIRLPLTPSLEQVSYYRIAQPSVLPTVLDWTGPPIEGGAGGSVHVAYAVPHPEEPGTFKVGLDGSGPDVDAETRSFDPDPARLARADMWAEERFAEPVPARPPETCLYTNTPDSEFVLDRVGPVVIGSPCSGHGFKFTPLIGLILTALATGEQPPVPLVPFAATRVFVRRLLSDRPFEQALES